MSKKITETDFLSRFYRNYPGADIELKDYTAISSPLTVKCRNCKREYNFSRARDCFRTFSCCGSHPEISKIDILKRVYFENEDFNFVKQIDGSNIIIQHIKCGQTFKREIGSALDSPFSCKFCHTNKTSQMLSIEEVQKTIDELFGGDIKILEYNGQLKTNIYKCVKCGLIFKQKQICLIQSRGCPKCDRFKSKGEKIIKSLLEKNQIAFEEQVAVPELPLQHFDFAIYSGDKISYFIEVNGGQYREQRDFFRDSLEKIQARDEKKRKFCKEKKIPLYELIYQKGKFKNLDILPLSSTTISGQESI